MSAKTKILVVKMRELIYTAIFLALIILLIVLLDIVCVAFSFFLALWFRFDLSINSIPANYLTCWQTTIPIWCAISIVVFAIFQLYNSVWSFVSENELFRMILAHICLFIIGFFCIFIFDIRMPRSYYFIGFLLSFLSTTALFPAPDEAGFRARHGGEEDRPDHDHRRRRGGQNADPRVCTQPVSFRPCRLPDRRQSFEVPENAQRRAHCRQPVRHSGNGQEV